MHYRVQIYNDLFVFQFFINLSFVQSCCVIDEVFVL